MSAAQELGPVAVAIVIAALGVGVAAWRRATGSGAGEVTARRTRLHQRSPRARLLIAITAAVVGVLVSVVARAPERTPATPASDSAAVAEAPQGADGTWLAVAVAIGVVVVTLGGIVYFRSQDTRS